MRAARTDSNHKEIRTKLRAAGYRVFDTASNISSFCSIIGIAETGTARILFYNTEAPVTHLRSVRQSQQLMDNGCLALRCLVWNSLVHIAGVLTKTSRVLLERQSFALGVARIKIADKGCVLLSAETATRFIEHLKTMAGLFIARRLAKQVFTGKKIFPARVAENVSGVTTMLFFVVLSAREKRGQRNDAGIVATNILSSLAIMKNQTIVLGNA